MALSLIMVSLINFTRPVAYAGDFVIDALMALSVCLCVPMRLGFPATGAAVFTLIEIFIWLSFDTFDLRLHNYYEHMLITQ